MLPISALSRSNILMLRRVCPYRPVRPTVRFQSTSSPPGGYFQKVDASHVAAGVAGGTVVLGIGYLWYQSSGLKTVVKTTKDMKQYLQSTQDSISSKAREAVKNPSQALSSLRGIAKTYSNFVPGGSKYVDDTFDELEYLYEMHVDEMDLILKETTEELIRETSKGRADTETARNVYDTVGRSIGRMRDLGKKAGADYINRNPAIKEKIGSAYEQLQSLAERAGPEGKKALNEVTSQLKDLALKGKIDEESLKKARDLIQEKTASIRRRAESSGGAAVSGGSEKLQQLFKNVPEADELFKKASHVQDLLNYAQDRSEEAKNLAKETVSDVMAVLEEKGKKAKELSERAKADGDKTPESRTSKA